MIEQFTPAQQRALAVITVIALAFGAYFLRHYFILIVIAAIVAYLFSPLYKRCRRRLNAGLSAAVTVLAAMATVIIPLGFVIFLAGLQISHIVVHVAEWAQNGDVRNLGTQVVDFVNNMLAKLPFGHMTVTEEGLRHGLVSAAQNVGKWLLHSAQGAAGGLIGGLTSAIVFLYVLISLLVNQQEVLNLIRRLNPLGEDVTDLYFTKMGAMVRGTVKGQFIIAAVQGVLGAASIYIGGFHGGFFLICIFLTALSVIPLGSGIVTIPFGIGMMFFGNVAGGMFVVLFHVIGVTNIDNFLRPILVPREAKLDPALMLLAVFSGLAMFGFWGIVLGPVVMIMIVTTVSVYLAVYHDVEMPQHPQAPTRRFMFRRPKPVAVPVAEPTDDAPSSGAP